ncbi:MAG TPA: PQQ-binding-like beta-propeller repeat protein [Acidimicrobiales bacterium]|nr:PQQ-binding-like beta-propeller repeat protein [Acidimicrobiales bacterium]
MPRRIRGAAVSAAALVSLIAAANTAGASRVPQPPEADSGAASWPYPDHDASNSRLATGSPITAKNLRSLTTAWNVSAGGGLATSPIVVGRNVFVEDQVGEVLDIGLTSGRVVWKSASNGYSVGPEGVAVGWRKVFGVTPTSLFALDEATGRQLWSTRLTRTATDGIDVQPQVIGREVIVSTVPVSVKGIYIGGDRGFVDAVNESSGKLLWGFDTVASPTLWGNPSVNSGGGSWYPPSFSPTSGLLYVGIANPAPFVGTTQYPNGSSRPGSNLYTDSTVALRISNGKLVWYHQADAHDLFDRDFVHTMIVPVPAATGHAARTVVVGTGKGGYVIGMNPKNGKQLWRTAVGIHENDNVKALTGPTEILPGTFGGVLTPPASAHGKVFVATLNAADTLYPDQTEYFGGNTGTMPGQIVAIDARNGDTLWNTHVPGDPTGGVTLVNNVVLTATLQGSIIGLSMSTGRILWTLAAPAGINGWLSVAGRYVIVPVGNAKPPTIWALRLPSRSIGT